MSDTEGVKPEDEFTDADRKAMKEVVRKEREAARAKDKELNDIRAKLAEREAEDERAKEAKLLEEKQFQELLTKEREKSAKQEALIKQIREEHAAKETARVRGERFKAHAEAVATKAGIPVTVVRGLLREAGNGEVEGFAHETNTTEVLDASVEILKALAPDLFETNASSGGSPRTPMLNTDTKANGETMSSEDKKYFEMGKKHSFRRQQNRA